MTGWRVGYCAAPAPVIAAMFLVLAAVQPRPGDVHAGRRAAALTSSQECVDRDAQTNMRDAVADR